MRKLKHLPVDRLESYCLFSFFSPARSLMEWIQFLARTVPGDEVTTRQIGANANVPTNTIPPPTKTIAIIVRKYLIELCAQCAYNLHVVSFAFQASVCRIPDKNEYQMKQCCCCCCCDCVSILRNFRTERNSDEL